jgi:hypothetical protein
MSQEPHREIQNKWEKCEKHWGEINKSMKDIGLPKFDDHDNFIDLCDIVGSDAKKDSVWAKDLAKVTDTTPRQVKIFMEHSMKAQTVLQQLNTSIVNYRAHAMEIRGFYMTPMEHHRFPWAQTCEDLFISWSEYEESHPFK